MFFPFYVENHSLATIFCSKGIDSGSETACLDQSFASLSSQILSRLSWHLKLFDVKLWHFSLVKLNNGLTSFTNSVTTSNVFVRHFNTSLRYSFALQKKFSWPLSPTGDEMSEISRHSLLEYWAFSKHCFL